MTYLNLVEQVKKRIFFLASGEEEKIQKISGYLLLELDHAIDMLSASIASKDWDRAKHILHREKPMLLNLQISDFDEFINTLLQEKRFFTDKELTKNFKMFLDAFICLRSAFK